MKKILFLLCVAAIFSACNKIEESAKLQNGDSLTQDAYDVYRALLYPLSSMNIIIDNTDTSLNCNYAKFMNLDSLGITSQIIEECKLLNKKSYTIEKDSFESGGLIFVTSEEFEHSESSLSLLTKYGSTGLYLLGCPVFYNNNQNAMFEVSFSCGPWCGAGEIVIAKKQNEIWVVTNHFVTWIS